MRVNGRLSNVKRFARKLMKLVRIISLMVIGQRNDEAAESTSPLYAENHDGHSSHVTLQMR